MPKSDRGMSEITPFKKLNMMTVFSQKYYKFLDMPFMNTPKSKDKHLSTRRTLVKLN